MKILTSLYSIVAAGFAAGVLIAGSALLQSAPASADLVTTKCGKPLRSTVKEAYNTEFTTSSSTFVEVTGASAAVNVPAGEFRCVKVRFFAMASCTPASSAHRCFVRVIDSASLLFPPSVILASDQPTYDAHGFEFAALLGEGSHSIQLKAATDGATLSIVHWTLDVEQANSH